MAEHLVFTLAAPVASFGVGAGNLARGSELEPGHGLIVGMLGAALGLEREDERLLALSEGLRVAVAMEARGAPMRDFHTVQSLVEKKRGETPRTRRAALARREDLHTTISERDYFCDVRASVALFRASGPFGLAEIAQALRTPRFVLYLGRKSCPLALPPAPAIIEAASADEAIRVYRRRMESSDCLFRVRQIKARVKADARLYPPDAPGRISRRRVAPGARAVWSYRLLDELTLAPEGNTP